MPLSKIYGAIPGLEEYAKVVEKTEKPLSGDRTPRRLTNTPRLNQKPNRATLHPKPFQNPNSRRKDG